ncbi:MAG: DUF4982 domain-containing protein [Dysgonamonadaceae bacterium]
MNKFTTLLITIFMVLGLIVNAQGRAEITLQEGWRFSREDNPQASNVNFDDSKWQTVRIPHDWAIYGPFSWQNDLQEMAITQDGQKQAMEHAGRTGGLPFVGVGWYRLDFKLPEYSKQKKASIIFDGAMSHAQVYLNGEKVGYWPYGYNSFHFDITPYLKDNETNTLAVRLENQPQSSRWYPGAGLYRNVHIVVTEDAHIPVWGTYVTTPVVRKDFAKVNVKTKVEFSNDTTLEVKGDKSNQIKYRLETSILNKNGHLVAIAKTPLSKYDEGVIDQTLIVDNPELWNIDNPVLYSVQSNLIIIESESEISTNKTTSKEVAYSIDSYNTPFGIRTIEVIPDKGFFLNGERVVFQGVCNHHDLGPLGAAVNDAAIRRQVRIMKDMGVNAIRTSHNMPAPELVRACDEMGMMLMVETFDEWKSPKMSNGYNQFFDEWAEKDLVNVIHHYRNNPSVVMWCIGNEVPEQGDGVNGPKRTRFLQDICNREDPTRPVTNGMDNPDAVTANGMAAILDVPGFNYRPFKYQQNYSKIPQQLVLGSETASTVSSRGVYKFPVERKAMAKYDDHQASSYDVEHCSWSDLPEDNFIHHEELPYAMGEFVWTGFDYLGEPTPYYSDWPSHSSLFGIVDLAGLPKDRYYLYRSHWNKDAETLHILPHWSWKGREGEVTPIFVYTNYPSAEVFINGKSQGKKTKDLSVKIDGSYTEEAQKSFERQKRYRLMWMDTKYEPGTVKVVAYDENGKAVAEKEMHTAGKPYKIVLEADRNSIKSDGNDLSFITVKVVDKDGNLCPDANMSATFSVSGEGFYRAGANGDPSCLDQFHLPQMHFFSGMLTAIVQSTDKAGTIVFEAKAKGLKSGKIKISTK